MDKIPLSIAIFTGSFWAATFVTMVYVVGIAFTSENITWSTFPWRFVLGFHLFIWLVAAIGASTMGLFWHAIAMWSGWTNVFSYALAGAFCGIAAPAILTSPIWIREWLSPPTEAFGQAFSLIATVIGGIVGLLSALFIWLIRRPDRDQPASSSNDTSA